MAAGAVSGRRWGVHGRVAVIVAAAVAAGGASTGLALALTRPASRPAHQPVSSTTTTARLPGVVADCAAAGDASSAATTEPTSIVIACADDGLGLQDLSWTAWTTASATGSGQLWENDCTPDCAGGTVHRYEASVTLGTVVASIEGPVFSVLHASYPHGGPGGKTGETLTLPVPPPVTPTCSAGQLQVSLSAPPATSGGSTQEALALTNVGPNACHLQGFPGVDLLDASGRSLGNAGRGCPWTDHWCATTPDDVELGARGGGAAFILAVRTAAAPGQRCPRAASLLVTPPNASDHLQLSLDVAVCGAPPAAGVGTVQSSGPTTLGYGAARQQWAGMGLVASSARQNAPLSLAVDDLQQGARAAGAGTAGDAAAVAAIEDFERLPITGVTSAQSAEGDADIAQVDRFFGIAGDGGPSCGPDHSAATEAAAAAWLQEPDSTTAGVLLPPLQSAVTHLAQAAAGDPSGTGCYPAAIDDLTALESATAADIAASAAPGGNHAGTPVGAEIAYLDAFFGFVTSSMPTPPPLSSP